VPRETLIVGCDRNLSRSFSRALRCSSRITGEGLIVATTSPRFVTAMVSPPFDFRKDARKVLIGFRGGDGLHGGTNLVNSRDGPKFLQNQRPPVETGTNGRVSP
jgi:hypothetical protein